jgi:hypothetical protein
MELNLEEKYIKTNKKVLKIKLDSAIRNYYLNSGKYYSMISIKQFLDYFFPSTFEYIILDNDNHNLEIDTLVKPDITVWDIQLSNNSLLKDDEINMLISVEHLSYWGHYHHYNSYGNYGNNKINIYLYNHITEMNIDLENKFIAIPMIHNYINYYLKNNNINHPSEYTEFKDKKFCLIINKSNLNYEIQHYVNIFSEIGEVDNISTYNNYIETKSCYHSQELLNVMNKYKFILCFENSYGNGYITEKIFNCFFANSIPIYKGSPIIENYINTNAFISLENGEYDIFEKIRNINTNPNLFNNIINQNKISESYNNEDYENKLSSFIEKFK